MRVYTRSRMDRSRLTTPLVRVDGELRPASWEAALDRAAAGFRDAIDDGAQVGVFSCSKATNELNYAAQKMSRVALHSNNVDSCNRT
jgi:predicted molibdopterin-dependent oxidoreductase YjgC